MLLQPNPLLWRAIEDRRMIRLLYHRRNRILEPHDHGILNGSIQLLAYQVGGSSSRPLPNWILMKAIEIAELAQAAYLRCGMSEAIYRMFEVDYSAPTAKLPSQR
jgi:hypothetical protein